MVMFPSGISRAKELNSKTGRSIANPGLDDKARIGTLHKICNSISHKIFECFEIYNVWFRLTAWCHTRI